MKGGGGGIGDKLIKTNEQYSGWGVEGDATQATTLGYSSFYQGGDYGKEIKPDGGKKTRGQTVFQVGLQWQPMKLAHVYRS